MSLTELSVEAFEAENTPLIDVRSPSEYRDSHLPGSINLPVLNDEHRHLVGTEYKQKGRFQAIQLGYSLVNPLKSELLEKAKKLAYNKQVRLYCARGGMRSRFTAEFLSENGLEVFVLKGGYKNFMRHVDTRIAAFKNLHVLSGFTGSGKTEILAYLKSKGEQVLELEDLASHSGSAFGALAYDEQPEIREFHLRIYTALKPYNPKKILWVENESFKIGKVCLPLSLWNTMQNAEGLEVEIPREVRIENIVEKYGSFEKEKLLESVSRIKKRLGNEVFSQIEKDILEDRYSLAADALLNYYDKSYLHGRKQRDCQNFVKIVFKHGRVNEIAEFLLKISSK